MKMQEVMRTNAKPPSSENSTSDIPVSDLLADLVAINSINPYRTIIVPQPEVLAASASARPPACELGVGNEREINNYLEKKLRQLGYHVERQVFQPAVRVVENGFQIELPERANVIAERGFGEKSLLLYAHTDTADIKSGWRHDPFVLTENRINDRLRWSGLGAFDLKAGIAAILAAAATEPPPGWKVKIAFLADEEFWSFGATRLLEHPFVSDVKLAVVPEIADSGRSPDQQWIGLGRLGRTEIVIDIEGHACHGADAELHPHAVNAVHEGAHLLSALARHSERSKKEFSREGVSAISSSYVNSFSGGKGIHSVPERAQIVFDRLLIPGESASDELQALETLIQQLRETGKVDGRAKIQVRERARPTPAGKPYFFSPNSPAARYVISCTNQLVHKVQIGIGRSVADENRFAEKGIPVIIVAPHGSGSHTSDEWVDAESLLRVTNILTKTISQLETFDSDCEKFDDAASSPLLTAASA